MQAVLVTEGASRTGKSTKGHDATTLKESRLHREASAGILFPPGSRDMTGGHISWDSFGPCQPLLAWLMEPGPSYEDADKWIAVEGAVSLGDRGGRPASCRGGVSVN